jgi:hypothetical protein
MGSDRQSIRGAGFGRGSVSELSALQDTLSRIVDDPSARGRSAIYLASQDGRLCTSAQLRVMHWLTSKPDLDPDLAEQVLWSLDRSSGGGCFSDRASAEAFDEAVRLALAWVASQSAARHAVSARTRAVHDIAPASASGAKFRLPGLGLARERSEFDAAGQARTESEPLGRILLYADPVGRRLRPAATDATIRLLARAGYDVDLPPTEHDCGWLSDELGDAPEAARRIAATIERWERALVRAVEDDRASEMSQLLTCDAPTAAYIRRLPARFAAAGGSISKALHDLMVEATDVTTWLCGTDIGPPLRWSSLRVGLLSEGDNRTRRVAETSRREATANLIRNAGYSIRDLAAGEPTASGGSGLLPWLATDLMDDLRRRHLSRVRAGQLDVLAVGEPGCQAVLAQAAPVPVVHVAELIDWAYGGPVPVGLDALADASVDVATPDAVADEMALAERA